MRGGICGSFSVYFSDLVGTVWDLGCPSSPVSFGKARRGCDTPLCLLSSGRQWRDYRAPARNSHYSQCFIHPPSSTTISPYWVTPQHTNKTLSSDHQAPTYTPNPPHCTALLVPLFLLLSYPAPPFTASMKTDAFLLFPFSPHYSCSLETHRLNMGICVWMHYLFGLFFHSNLPYSHVVINSSVTSSCLPLGTLDRVT